ncbi:hypothetical protein NDU88_004132 [Pleurodeles waltl]|uniref:Uncharacterized protein n=1 Tax=Pleurodeles waltl TaxID=8319 RepID=A0AAV7SHX4_PLEWA|nr:hypothetical protein NDU88_004132 [Pleurodeles waltl]
MRSVATRSGYVRRLRTYDDRTHASSTRMRDPRLLGQPGFSTSFRGVHALGPLCCRARCPRAAGITQESCGLSLSQKCR